MSPLARRGIGDFELGSRRGGMSDLTPAEGGERSLVLHFLILASKFYSGPFRRMAWALSFGFLGCLIANMALALALNRWSKNFFDALQLHDVEALKRNIVVILALGAATTIVAATLIQMRMRLQLRWRQWLTGFVIGRWLRHRRFYQLSGLGLIDNPEARIADDGRLSIELLVDLTGGVINTLLLSTSFIIVLFHVGGSLSIGGWTVPGYLVISVIAYSMATSFIMYRLSAPMVRRVEEKAAGEGDFRYALTRTRDKAAALALKGGDEDEKDLLGRSFEALADRWIAVIGRQTWMIVQTSGDFVLGPAVALLLCTPKYLAGEMSLGDMMQSVAAFAQVHLALNWLADNALSLANWSASARRVAALDLAYKKSGELLR
jgi:putative ATP-binding cassette transporter